MPRPFSKNWQGSGIQGYQPSVPIFPPRSHEPGQRQHSPHVMKVGGLPGAHPGSLGAC